jgi:hypothetical protein
VRSFIRKRARGLITCCEAVAACKVERGVTRCGGDVNTLRAGPTLVYFRLDRLQRVSTHVQQMWGIIGHVTAEAGSRVGTDGAPPQAVLVNKALKF